MAKVSMSVGGTDRLSYRSKQWDEIDPRSGVTGPPYCAIAPVREVISYFGLTVSSSVG